MHADNNQTENLESVARKPSARVFPFTVHCSPFTGFQSCAIR